MSDWDAHYATDAGARHWPNEELVRWLSGRRFMRVLDAGCGTGSNLSLLGQHARAVHSCDPNEHARTAALKVLTDRPWGDFNGATRSGVVYPPTDAEVGDLGFQSGFFGLVVDCMVSQHLPWAEHEAAYREYARVLGTGGYLWLYHLDAETESSSVAVPGELFPDYSSLALFPDVSLFCLPTASTLASMVRSAGFEVREMRGLAREYPDGQVAHYSIIAAQVPRGSAS